MEVQMEQVDRTAKNRIAANNSIGQGGSEW